MKRKKVIRIIGIIILVILIGCLVFFIFLPMMILPSESQPLFFIDNDDIDNHTVTVEIFNSKNKSIYHESFYVQSDKLIHIDRGFNWCPKNRFYWFFWDEGSYTFYVTLDNTYNESYYTELYPLKSVWINVDFKNKSPLHIGAVTI